MSVSIVDIAKKTGVSHTTVSRILRNAQGFSFAKATCDKVKKAAAEMGYAPNLAAKFMRTKQTRMIGITTESEYSYATYRMIQNCSIAIRQLGYSPVLVDMNEQNDSNGFIGRLDFLAGLICLAKAHEKSAAAYCEKMNFNIPIITMKNKASDSANVREVTNNSQEIIEDALKHLKELGHKNIAYLGYENFNARVQAFTENARKLKINNKAFGVKVKERNNSYLNGSSCAKKIAESGNITACLCEDDEFALGLISGLKEMNISVPDDFSVIGFDDLPFAIVSSPKLTTIRVRCLKRANAAAKLLISLIESNDVQKELLPESIFFECKLIVRESTGKAKK
jgi:DNA-binding LacI/PurR family transcriptional regulator